MFYLQLTDREQRTMIVTPATVDVQIFLTMKLAGHGVSVELKSTDPDERIGLTSGRRFPLEERPPMSPAARELFQEHYRLTRAWALEYALDADLDRQIRDSDRKDKSTHATRT